MPHFHIWSMSSEIYSKSLLNPAVLSPYLPVNHEFFGTQHSPLLHHTLCENRINVNMRFSHKMNLEVTYVPHSKTDCEKHIAYLRNKWLPLQETASIPCVRQNKGCFPFLFAQTP